jgi:hypothetical protein
LPLKITNGTNALAYFAAPSATKKKMFHITDALILADNVESAVLTLVEKMSKEFHSFAFSQRSVILLAERLFIEAAFHQSSFSSKQLFIKAAFHQSSFSSKQLFIKYP